MIHQFLFSSGPVLRCVLSAVAANHCDIIYIYNWDWWLQFWQNVATTSASLQSRRKISQLTVKTHWVERQSTIELSVIDFNCKCSNLLLETEKLFVGLSPPCWSVLIWISCKIESVIMAEFVVEILNVLSSRHRNSVNTILTWSSV